MTLSLPAKRQLVIDQGLNPDEYDYDEVRDGFVRKSFQGVATQEDPLTTSETALPVRATPSKLGSAGRSFLSNILPTAASFAGGAGAGLAATALISGPAAPIAVPAVAGVGALLSGLATSKAQEAILPAVVNKQLAEDAATNPWSTLGGGLAAGGLLLKPGLEQAKQAGSGLVNLLTRLGGIPTDVTPNQTAALVNTAIQAAPPAVRAIQGEHLDPALTAADFLANVVLSKPNKYGRMVGLQDAPLDPQYELFNKANAGGPAITQPKADAVTEVRAAFEAERAAKLAREFAEQQRATTPEEAIALSLKREQERAASLGEDPNLAHFKALAEERQKAAQLAEEVKALQETEAEQARARELADAQDVTAKMKAEAERLKEAVKSKSPTPEEVRVVTEDLVAKEREAQDASLRAAAVELRQKTGVPLAEDELAGVLDKTAHAGVSQPGEVRPLTAQEKPAFVRGQEDVSKFESKKPLPAIPVEAPKLTSGAKALPTPAEQQPRKPTFQDARDEVSKPATKGLLDYFTRLGANFRGIKTKVTGEIIGDRGKPVRGVSLVEEGTNDLLAKVSAKLAKGDTIPHEQFHFFWDYLTTNPSGKMQAHAEKIRKAVAETPEFKKWDAVAQRGVDEYITTKVGEGLFQRVAGKKATDGLKDALSAIKSKLGAASVDDYARLLGRKYLFDEKIDLKSKITGSTPRFQDRLVSQTEAEFEKERPFKLVARPDGTFNSKEVLAAIGKMSAAEQFAVKPLVERLKEAPSVSKQQALEVLRKEGSQVAFKDFKIRPIDESYRADVRARIQLREEIATLQHEFLDNLTRVERTVYFNRRPLDAGMEQQFAHDLRTEGWKEADVQKAVRLYTLERRHADLTQATIGEGEDSPRWHKLSNKSKDYMKSHDYTEKAVTADSIESNKIHEPFPENTLVHVRHYTTAPGELAQLDSRFSPKDRVVKVLEVQSDAKQSADPRFSNHRVEKSSDRPGEWSIVADDSKYPDRPYTIIWGFTSKERALQDLRTRKEIFLTQSNHPLYPETNRIGLKSVIAEVAERNKSLPEGEKITHLAIDDAESVMMNEGHFTQASTKPKGIDKDSIFGIEILPSGEVDKILYSREDIVSYLRNVRALDGKSTTDLNSLSDDALMEEATRVYNVGKEEAERIVFRKPTVEELKPTSNEGMQHNYAATARLVDRVTGEEIARFDSAKEAADYVNFYIKKELLPENALDPKEGTLNIVRGDLHDTAEELTGDKGKTVDFGEHELLAHATQKEKDLQKDSPYAPLEPRDKINKAFFSDIEGKPLTSKARVYSLEKPLARLAAGEKLTITGRKFQDVVEAPADVPPQPFWKRVLSPQIDKVKALGGIYEEIANAASRHFARRDQLEARFVDMIHKELRDAPTEEVSEALTYARDKFRGEATGPRPATKSMDVVQAFFRDVRKFQNEVKLPVVMADGTTRAGGQSEYYASDFLSDKAMQEFVRNPISAKSEAQIKEWVDYTVKASGQNRDVVEKNIRAYINAMASGVKTTEDFNALTKAQGYGVPESIRETDPWKILSKYGSRSARTLAYWMEIQNNPRVAGSLKLHQPDGKLSPLVEGTKAVAGQEDTEALMRYVLNDFPANRHPRLTAAIRAVNNALFGLPTGLRDLVSVPGITSNYIPTKDSGVFVKAALQISDFVTDSLETGARNGRLDLKRFRGLTEPDEFTSFLNKLAEGFRKYQGRDFLEQGARIYAFAIGKLQGKTMLARAAAGDSEAVSWLKQFDTLIDTPMEKWGNAELNQVAKNFVDKVQGTFDARGLPASVEDSQFAPFITLQKWGIERFNNFRKDVVLPASKGNLGPLLKATLSGVLTGAVIQQLTEALSGKKPNQPTLAESEDNLEYQTAAALTLLQLGSYGGILGDFIKAGVDVGVYKQAPRIAGFPAADSVAEVGQAMTEVAKALEEGQDPLETGLLITWKLLSRHIQNLNYLANWAQPEETARKNNERDLRAFRALEGADKPFTFSGSFLSGASGLAEKKFKKTEDVDEAVELSKGLVENAIKKSTLRNGVIDVEKLAKLLSSLRRDSEKQIPTEPGEMSRFSEFVGKDQFLDRYQASQKRRALAKIKSQLIPKI